MDVRYYTLKSFAAELDRAGWEYLTNRGVAPAEPFRLGVEKCPVHGPGCARVTYGMLRDHVQWALADAAALAPGMLRTMLTPAGETRGGCGLPAVARRA